MQQRHALSPRLRWITSVAATLALALGPAVAASAATASDSSKEDGLTVSVALDDGVVDAPATGRLLFLVAARGAEPLDDVWVQGSRFIYGQNVADFTPGASVTMRDGGAEEAADGVYGYPYAALGDLPSGDYTARAFLVRYDGFDRADGSHVDLYQPCGDGGSPLNGPGNLMSSTVDFSVGDAATNVRVTLDQVRDVGSTAPEIGGCRQGNFTDHENVRYIKILSKRLSEFWGTEVYVGANVRLPLEYDPDRAEAYPVIYSQSHWPGGGTPFWDNAGDSRFIFVSIRQESAYYDDAYSVNSANLGPWGDAIAEELVPEIDRRFHTIAAPYGRLQEGGSTGGWTSLASTLFRPDVYGATWSYYPDSLDFHRHQAVDLYKDTNAYFDAAGAPIGSWREGDRVTVTMEQENHYELALGTNSRSFDQWDVWNAVFSPQGYNGYPLDPWDKIDGTIDHDTTALWEQQFDLTAYLRKNWSGPRNLGQALEGRIHVSVGTLDNYYLEGGVQYFKSTVDELGGPEWAEIEIEPGRAHEGYYDYLPLQEQLDRMWTWVNDHAPNGPDPLTAEDTAPTTEGNDFDEVLAWGGREAAIDRQAPPTVDASSVTVGDTLTATFGSWDPGMTLRGQWTLDGQPLGDAIDLRSPSLAQVSDERASYAATQDAAGKNLAFTVTGTKRGYDTETRSTPVITVTGAPAPSASATPIATPDVSPTLPVATPAPSTTITTHATQPLATTGTARIGLPLILAAIAAMVVGLTLAAVRNRRRTHP